jgi:hypothetical protein
MLLSSNAQAVGRYITLRDAEDVQSCRKSYRMGVCTLCCMGHTVSHQALVILYSMSYDSLLNLVLWLLMNFRASACMHSVWLNTVLGVDWDE